MKDMKEQAPSSPQPVKKEWTTPELISYGDVAEITRQKPIAKRKIMGTGDDFAVVDNAS